MPLGIALHLGDQALGGGNTCPAQASRQTLILIVPCMALWPGREATREWDLRQGVLRGWRGLWAACQGSEARVCPDVLARRLSAGKVPAGPSRVLSTLPLLGHGHPSLELRGPEACGGVPAPPATERPLWAEGGRRTVLGRGRLGRDAPPAVQAAAPLAVLPVGCQPGSCGGGSASAEPLGRWCFFNILITVE